MRQLHEWASRAWSVLRPTRDDADLAAELRSHLARAAEAGAAPGNVAQAMDALRDQRAASLKPQAPSPDRFLRTPANL